MDALKLEILKYLASHDDGNYHDVSHITKASAIKGDPIHLKELVDQLYNDNKIFLQHTANRNATTYENPTYTIFCKITESAKKAIQYIVGKDIDTEIKKETLIWTKRNMMSALIVGIITAVIALLGILTQKKDSINYLESSNSGIEKPNQMNRDSILPLSNEGVNTSTSPQQEQRNNSIAKTDTLKIPIGVKSNYNRGDIIFDKNNYINDTKTRTNIAVLVFDNYNHFQNSIASEIATLYRNKGYSVITSLFTNSFLTSKYLNEVQNANSQVIDKLGLSSMVDYIVIAKYSNEFEEGELTKWISRANLEVSIIACSSKSLIDGFPITAANGYDDKQNAEKGAKEKIISAYKASHLNL